MSEMDYLYLLYSHPEELEWKARESYDYNIQFKVGMAF